MFIVIFYGLTPSWFCGKNEASVWKNWFPKLFIAIINALQVMAGKYAW